MVDKREGSKEQSPEYFFAFFLKIMLASKHTNLELIVGSHPLLNTV